MSIKIYDPSFAMFLLGCPSGAGYDLCESDRGDDPSPWISLIGSRKALKWAYDYCVWAKINVKRSKSC